MGYKLWSFKESLSSNDVNNYLMSQVVARFDSTGERSSAITSPQTNQYAYVTGVGLTRWDGSAWVVEIAASSPTINRINFSTLYSHWSNYGSYQSASYYKDFSGVVH